MRGRLAVIEADEQLREQVVRQVEAAGVIADPFETLDGFMLISPGGDHVVLVGDDIPMALGVSEQLRTQGHWLAVIAYATRPNLRRVVAVLRGGGYDYFSLPLDTAALLRTIEHLADGGAPYAAACRRAAVARTRLAHLSPREREVLSRMAGGYSNGRNPPREHALEAGGVLFHRTAADVFRRSPAQWRGLAAGRMTRKAGAAR